MKQSQRCGPIVSDSGPQFTSETFQRFARENGIKHVTGAPYHPSTNGLAEIVAAAETPKPTTNAVPTQGQESAVRVTRSGRVVKTPARFGDYER